MQQWTQYGIEGLVILALSAYVLRIEKRHKEERKEWREMTDKREEKSDKRQEETNRVIRETGGILSGLKTLLENRR